MKKLNIALLAGGDSSEREVSLRSAAQVQSALDAALYNVFLVDVHGREWVYDGRWKVDLNDFSLTVDGAHTTFDYALILIHGTPGEDGRLQGYLDVMGVPYSSCGMVSTVVTFDKQLCKQTVTAAGVSVARGVMIRRGQRVCADEIAALLGDAPLPWFVKPNASGSSFGVTKIYSREELATALATAFAESDEALVEEFVAGREIACGVLLTADGETVLPLTEIVPANDFFDYEAKYTAGLAREITPAELDCATAEQVRSLALVACRACGCRGIVRADFIVPDDGRPPVMIEINSVPGMSAGSIVPQQAAAAGMTLGELFDAIIDDTRA
ncbi:MAG: D-alanine--D-alanine ligase [Rikenellaceae bacterium]|nr:D-alanine--D-alanine ligase [Rikenellaceae bacterium]MCL2691891.1 D-alanine--D-alanine ligase [Rikenellaceae bacterium]